MAYDVWLQQSKSMTGSSQVHKGRRWRRLQCRSHSSTFSLLLRVIRLLEPAGFTEILERFSRTEATATREYLTFTGHQLRFWVTSSHGFPLDGQRFAHYLPQMQFYSIAHRI